MTRRAELQPGIATGLGSLPHTDAAAAAAFVLRLHPELPAAPQLPHRSPSEAMVVQAVDGIPGVVVAPDGSLRVDGLDPEAEVDASFEGEAWGGLRSFLRVVSSRRRPIKLQVTGPVTLANALVRSGVESDLALAVASHATRARTKALVALAERSAPEAPVVLFLDEPSLTRWLDGDLPFSGDDAVDSLSSVLAIVGADVTTGIHCCGDTDWGLVMSAGTDIVSAPVGGGLTREPMALASFLEAGGRVAWGAVPTDGPVGAEPDRLWRRLVDEWCLLTQGGCDPALLRSHSLVTPACGLAGHTVSTAERALALASKIGEKVEDQALGTRLIVGA
ncbi:MAG TPA: hypothetical protein VMY34_10945 [Acidimicrobiales bacterium]|nr:hypothetical protein [Acidimicrobiales bacterium]